MVGVKSYFPENTPELSHFRKRFRQKFDSNYPEEEYDEPGIFAVQGYNAVKLSEKYLPENIQEWEPIPEPTVEIVSVIGKKYNSVYWTEGLGFSDDINGATAYTHSMQNVGQALWPVQPWYAHRRRRNLEKTSRKRLRVAVPCKSLFNEFVKCDPTESNITGFVIEVFHEMMAKLNQPYDAIQFNGDKMHSNLSRMAVVVWLFVALVIIQSYTASLASMLTTQKQQPTITSVDLLRKMNAAVGYCNGSFVNEYLEEVLAIFLEVPAAKVFLAKYCRSFIRTGETFKVGGFGFAFGRRFSRLSEANKALMSISESRKLKEIEDKYLNSGKCVDEESSPEENQSLNFHSFWGFPNHFQLVRNIVVKLGYELKRRSYLPHSQRLCLPYRLSLLYCLPLAISWMLEGEL
ncbi:hypothetical protein L1987_14683 [Smallanthus sonchifolius]|uniref:Uncharacterized protein n=1 Tax=Smallanthus sonchifolius TaxID=185202 RepID=A0ACB9J4H9_9ASTR|nr:hypothetical protein L1987_14683 [Smallanthus sonchifolius]